MKLSVGQVVHGRFEVERVLGAGGTALVYLVRERASDTRHALKLLTISSSAIRERMLQEGRVQARIQHPNVIRVSEVLDVEGAPALVMEYVDGPSLEQALGRYRLTMGDAETLFQGILAGVAAAHAEGLVHRDLKPANILLSRTRDGFVPKVTDFGLAKLTDSDGVPQMGQTRSGIAMGTPSYMAPEQIRDARSVDRRADVWSLGCMLYELVSRQRAFPGDEALAIYNAIVEGEFLPVRKLVGDLPPRLEQAIHGCLRVELDARIPDCDTLLAVLLGVKEWPLPEETFTDLPTAEASAVPEVAREPVGAQRRSGSVIEYHPGGAATGATGATAASAPTALAPMNPELPRRSPLFSGGGGLASEAETPAPIPDYDGDEAATVITKAVLPPLDGSLAPHLSPVAPPAEPSERTGLVLGGGLVVVAVLALFVLVAVGLVLLVFWVFVPAPGVAPPAPVPVAAPAPVAPDPTPLTTPDPAPTAAPTPAAEPTTSGSPPAPPAPRPTPPTPAPTERVAPAPPGPRPAPRPPAPVDATRQRPDAGVPDKVTVHLETIPPGAAIHIGNLSGAGPYDVQLTPSRHPVIVLAPGYEAFNKLIAVSVDGKNAWCFDLVKREMLPGSCP